MEKTGKRHRKSDLDKIKVKYYKMYCSWNKIYCPALDSDVTFTRAGWDHLCVTKFRTGVEQEKRLKILPLTKKLISTTTTIQGQRYKNGFFTYEFFALMGGIKVTAVVSKTKSGYIYWSTFRD